MKYLITYCYTQKWSGDLRYVSFVTATGVSVSEAIAMKFADQYNAEFGGDGERPTNSRENLNVVSVVELQEDHAQSVSRYVSSC